MSAHLIYTLDFSEIIQIAPAILFRELFISWCSASLGWCLGSCADWSYLSWWIERKIIAEGGTQRLSSFTQLFTSFLIFLSILTLRWIRQSRVLNGRQLRYS